MEDSLLTSPPQNASYPHIAHSHFAKKGGEELLEGRTHHIAATGRLGCPEKLRDIENFIGTSPLSLEEVV